MSSTVGSVAVATSDTLGNTSDAVNDHISKSDKEHARRASLPCIWDSSIWSSVRYTCGNSWYCSDSTCRTLNNGSSYLSHRRGKPRRGRSETGLCLDRRTNDKWNRSKSQTWCHIPYNVTRHLAVYRTDCTWFVEHSSSLTHGFSQLHRGKSDRSRSCYNTEPEKNISLHNAHSSPCFSVVDFVMESRPPRLFHAVIHRTRCCLATICRRPVYWTGEFRSRLGYLDCIHWCRRNTVFRLDTGYSKYPSTILWCLSTRTRPSTRTRYCARIPVWVLGKTVCSH